eukprot:TRINITY_DN1407_c1_g1_i2.p1 TRINITY_DN1407_c1_g1~~TRINITY_DN1407_c1_g1_i2.p1  ORF type:complete len:198 (+),score=62.65 TRINITY_DN1407_c1_g1_i2:51-644(+)
MVKRIGRYELGKTLGKGTFSKVKYGVDTETNAAFAIKIIDKAQLQKEHMEEQLKREIAIMKHLKHEHIVQLKEVLQTAKHIYIVLELITGGELFDRIVAAKRFDENTGRKYFQQLIMGIYYCHQQGIAHRDLKPENLVGWASGFFHPFISFDSSIWSSSFVCLLLFVVFFFVFRCEKSYEVKNRSTTPWEFRLSSRS